MGGRERPSVSFQSPCGDLLIGNLDSDLTAIAALAFQSPCGDLLIGNQESPAISRRLKVSVPLRGFINRKRSHVEPSSTVCQVSVPLRGFINRKPMLASLVKMLSQCFSPLAGIY